ncbi:unnamed protein product [Paramecium sonneborni]|uniref:Uncharacterized protein n=1 Tax=Paramecium sonneborni TaxID=65129 RepID=A0A8S1NGL1_9CILI|nr:unnamed protein product [Paramecium sonneborni]
MDKESLKNQSNYQTYQVLNSQQIKKGCFEIAINIQQSLLLMASRYEIQIAFFKFGKFKQFQVIKQEKQFSSILYFHIRKSNFITNDGVSSLKIWSSNLLASIKFIQKLRGHKSSINCLLLNSEEDIVITGSNDYTIRSWKQKNEQWSSSQIIFCHNSFVYGLSINKQGNKLISCSRDCTIVVNEFSNSNQIWTVSQIIQVDKLGYIIGFICDSVFVYQPIKMNLTQAAELNSVGNDSLYIYQLDHEKKYIKKKQLLVFGDGELCESKFSFQYCSSNNLLLIKNGSQINLVKVIKNNKIDNECLEDLYNFQLNQVISFDPTYCKGKIYGTMSSDGQYIIISNYSQKIIEIREYKKQD